MIGEGTCFKEIWRSDCDCTFESDDFSCFGTDEQPIFTVAASRKAAPRARHRAANFPTALRAWPLPPSPPPFPGRLDWGGRGGPSTVARPGDPACRLAGAGCPPTGACAQACGPASQQAAYLSRRTASSGRADPARLGDLGRGWQGTKSHGVCTAVQWLRTSGARGRRGAARAYSLNRTARMPLQARACISMLWRRGGRAHHSPASG